MDSIKTTINYANASLGLGGNDRVLADYTKDGKNWRGAPSAFVDGVLDKFTKKKVRVRITVEVEEIE